MEPILSSFERIAAFNAPRSLLLFAGRRAHFQVYSVQHKELPRTGLF